MRFFHGDHPAQAVEIGQQEGGHLRQLRPDASNLELNFHSFSPKRKALNTDS